MEIVNIKINKLKLYEKNAKTHPKENIEAIKKSIQKYGFSDPIGVWGKQNIIVEGHGRYLACKELGIDEVPCIRLDHLTDEERREYTLMHNKTTMMSDFDFDLLGEELPELNLRDFDLDWGLPELVEEEKEEIEKPEVEFTEIMNEESNYLILKFETDIDWLQALSLFDIKEKKAYSTRKDGKINDKMVRKGVGRVINGAEFMNKIMEMMK